MVTDIYSGFNECFQADTAFQPQTDAKRQLTYSQSHFKYDLAINLNDFTYFPL